MKNILLLLALFLSVRLHAQKDTVEEYIKQGIELHDKGEYKAALEKYGQALRLDNTSNAAHYEMASTYYALKDYSQALRHIDIIISAGSEFMDQAYILKGSVLDLQGKSEEAIATYEKAIKSYPNNYLLYYNLALTLFNNKGEMAKIIADLQKALQLNPDHPGSHALLGYTMIAEGKKVQSVLSLYNFLLLEPASGRSASALTILLEQMQSGVSQKEEKSTQILFDPDEEFRAASLTLSMLAASKTLEENKNKTELELFIKNTKTFFNVIGGLKKENKDFWWDFYVRFFSALDKAGHTEAFCYYIWQARNDVKANQWLKNNPGKLKQFSGWYDSYPRQF